MEAKIAEFLSPAIFDEHKYTIIPAGRRTGKTFNSAVWIIAQAWQGKKCLWVDTRNINIEKYLDRYFRRILGNAWFTNCQMETRKNTLRINNGYIDFGTAESPERIEGFAYDSGVLNEAGIILKKRSLWENTLQPMFKADHAKVKIIGTPKSRNIFHEMFIRGNSPDTEYKSFRYTVYDSPYWKPNEIEAIKQNVPQMVWNQEYMADFLDNSAGVFNNIRGCIRDIHQLDKALPNKKYVVGIDLAKHTDFTVIVVADRDTKEVVCMERFNQIDWVFQKKKIVEIWERFNKPQVMMDSTGVGDPVYDDLYRIMSDRLQGYKLNNASKKELIEGLALALEGTLLYYNSNEVLLSELDSYEYEITRAGNITYNAPEGLHDDCVIALALCWQLLKPDNSKYGYFVL